MIRLKRKFLVFTAVCFFTSTHAQNDIFGFSLYSIVENAHTRKIDSLDTIKPDLNAFKLLYKGDSAIKTFDTTRSYVLLYSDTIKYDRSDRRNFYQSTLIKDTIQDIYNNGNTYYYSKTFKYVPTTLTASQVLEKYLIRDKYLTPVNVDSTSQAKMKPSNKTYYDHFVPYVYNNKILVLQQHHGYHGYNHVGLVKFSNYVNHYFVITE